MTKNERIAALEERLEMLEKEFSALQMEMTFIMLKVIGLQQNPLAPSPGSPCPGYPPQDPWKWGRPNTGDPMPGTPIIWCESPVSQTSSDSTAPAALTDA